MILDVIIEKDVQLNGTPLVVNVNKFTRQLSINRFSFDLGNTLNITGPDEEERRWIISATYDHHALNAYSLQRYLTSYLRKVVGIRFDPDIRPGSILHLVNFSFSLDAKVSSANYDVFSGASQH